MTTEKKTIGEISEVFDGPHATPKKTETGPYFLSIASLESGRLNLSKSAHLDEEQFTKWTRRITPQEGDVLFSYETRLGEAALMPGGIRGCLGRRMGLLRPKRDVVIPQYLLYAYLAPAFQEEIRARTVHGATVDRIALQELPEFPIRIPSLNEQQRVVRLLSALDDKITLNRKQNETLEALARALFQSWFVDFDPVKAKLAALKHSRDPELAAMAALSGKLSIPPRKPKPETLDDQLPSADDIDASIDSLNTLTEEQRQSLAQTASHFPDSFEESELGLIPVGWNIESLGSQIDVLETGRRPKGGVGKYKEGIPSIGAESIWGIGNFDYSKTKFVPEEFFEKMKSGKVEWYDVLLYKDGGKPGDFKPRVAMYGEGYPFENFGINEHVFRIRSSSLGQPFLYYQLGSDRILEDLANRGGKAAIPGINQTDVKTLDFLKPSDGSIEVFNEQVQGMIKKILANCIENQSLAELRDTLLPKLLSGELPVSAAEEQVEATLES